MTEEPYYRIVKWDEYQHYSDRSPAWVKLHSRILTSDLWIMADDASRVLIVASILLAARYQNRIPANQLLIKKVANLNCDPDFSLLVKYKFIELVGDTQPVTGQGCSTTLAEGYQKDSEMLAAPRALAREEKRREEKKNTMVAGATDVLFCEFWKVFPRIRKQKRGTTYKSWKVAITKADPQHIIDKAKEFAASPKGRSQYANAPEVWLNSESWDADPVAWLLNGQTKQPDAIQPGPTTNKALEKAKAADKRIGF